MANQRSPAELEDDAVSFEDLLSRADAKNGTTSSDFLKAQQKRLLQTTDPTVDSESRSGSQKIPRTAAQSEVAGAAAQMQLQERVTSERNEEGRYRERQQSVQTQLSLRRSLKKDKTVLSLTDRVKNTATALAMVSAWGFVWSCLQLPLAIASLVFLAIGAGLKATWIGRTVAKGAEAVNAVTSVFGADFSSLAPTSVGLSLNFVLFGLLLLGIMGTVFAYVIRGQDPLFGSYSEAKIGALIVAIMGYSLPLVNLFPWIGLYIYIMWLSPRSSRRV